MMLMIGTQRDGLSSLRGINSVRPSIGRRMVAGEWQHVKKMKKTDD